MNRALTRLRSVLCICSALLLACSVPAHAKGSGQADSGGPSPTLDQLIEAARKIAATPQGRKNYYYWSFANAMSRFHVDDRNALDVLRATYPDMPTCVPSARDAGSTPREIERLARKQQTQAWGVLTNAARLSYDEKRYRYLVGTSWGGASDVCPQGLPYAQKAAARLEAEAFRLDAGKPPPPR